MGHPYRRGIVYIWYHRNWECAWITFIDGRSYFYQPLTLNQFQLINTQVATCRKFNSNIRVVERPPEHYEELFGFYSPEEYTDFVDVQAPIPP